MLYLLSYNSEVTTHALGVLSSYLELIDCQKYLFTTNGGTGGSYHPDRMTLAYLWKYSNYSKDNKLTLYFNYSLSSIEVRNIGILSSEEQKIFNIVDNYENNSLPKIAL